jgi:hypothetical protein
MLTVVADEAIAVLPGGLPQDLIDEVWEGLDSGDGVAAVLDALGRASGAASPALPPFAVALLQGDAVRTAVRGPLRLTVETLAGELEVTAAATDTWTVRLVEDALSVRVRPAHDAPASASELPVGSGAVLAASVRAVFFEAEAEDEAEDEAEETPGDAAPADDAGGSAEAPSETLLPDDTRLVAAPPVDELAVADTIAVPRRPEPEPVSEPEPDSEPAAPPPVDTLDPRMPSGPLTALGDHDGATISAAQFAAQRAAAAGPVGTHEPDATPPATDGLGDHDGATIAVAPGARPTGPRGAGTTAEVPVDDAWDEPHDRLDPAPMPRFDVPSLPGDTPSGPGRGRVRISTGEAVELDRPVIVGRRPRSSRTTGADMPRLVAVESPQNDISRNHVEISSDGETVVVTDLHSTNGTMLYRTGLLGASADPVRLHPGEQTVIVPGDIVDIGDGVTISFEDLS